VERIQPPGLHDPGQYAQCIRTGNTLYLAGQVGVDERGDLVGKGDVEAQAEQVWRNIGTILRAAGADYRSIVKLTTYLVDVGDRETAMRVRARYLADHLAASTLVGTTALAQPDFLIEVDVTAVIE
jgi:enamine deaminase RidA (YjgF/YER057c/UK114 family)